MDTVSLQRIETPSTPSTSSNSLHTHQHHPHGQLTDVCVDVDLVGDTELGASSPGHQGDSQVDHEGVSQVERLLLPDSEVEKLILPTCGWWRGR